MLENVEKECLIRLDYSYRNIYYNVSHTFYLCNQKSEGADIHELKKLQPLN